MVPSLAGPKRPQDRVALTDMKSVFQKALSAPVKERGYELSPEAMKRQGKVGTNGGSYEIGHGAVVIAAITSCTNTSNPSVMVAAGLVAKKAVEKGLTVKPYVKTSLAPGTRVVTDYLKQADLLEPLSKLGFNVVAYGCTTCIGNSGPLPGEVAKAVTGSDLVAAAVISGNRNFEGQRPPAGKGELPGFATAGGGVCPGRNGGYRPVQRTDRDGQGWAGLSQGYLADLAGGGRGCAVERDQRNVLGQVCQRVRGFGHVERYQGGGKRPVPVGRGFHLHPASPVLPVTDTGRAAHQQHPGGTGAGLAGRLDHHRPHFSCRQYCQPTARRASTCRSAACRCATSTRTAPGAAMTG